MECPKSCLVYVKFMLDTIAKGLTKESFGIVYLHYINYGKSFLMLS